MGTPAILALADGTILSGTAIGAEGKAVGEIVFNTSMTGYQEILTDPSYAQQIVTLTYPHIGNVGTNPEDEESNRIWAAGLVIRDLPLLASNWRNKQPLDVYLREHNIVAIADVDTRMLTRIIRDKGAQGACIMTGVDVDETAAVTHAQSFPGLLGADLAQVVSTKQAYQWHEGAWQWSKGFDRPAPSSLPYHVVVYDYGVKRSILRQLVSVGCALTVVPANTDAAEILAMNPDAVVLSNGPGDPAACDYAINNIKTLLEADMPLLGICLGCQLLALACGAKTRKMAYGHHGANHPVQQENGAVTITSQNHGFAIDDADLPDCLTVTARSLFDQTVQGITHKEKLAIAMQGHPEAGPGPHDWRSVFQQFIQLLSSKTDAKTS